VRIGVDVMGGDNAPDAILAGSLASLEQLAEDDRLVLVGDARVIEETLTEHDRGGDARIEVVPTTELVAMDDPPVQAIREKPDSSMVRLARLGSPKTAPGQRCDAILSAGNTGACVAAAQMAMRRLPGVHRPGIAVTIPTFHGPVVLCDVGANPEPKPHHLYQYAHMASVYARRAIGAEAPRVALLSIGGEEGKGNALVRQTSALVRADPDLNYIGYIEGRGLFNGEAEVVITEGFTGNVVLKLAEGLAAGLFATIAHEIFETDPELAVQFEPIVKQIYKKHDYHEFGGAPLLGAGGICLILHGSSEARTVQSAVLSARDYARLGVNEQLVQTLASHQPAGQEEVA